MTADLTLNPDDVNDEESFDFVGALAANRRLAVFLHAGKSHE